MLFSRLKSFMHPEYVKFIKVTLILGLLGSVVEFFIMRNVGDNLLIALFMGMPIFVTVTVSAACVYESWTHNRAIHSV